MYKFTYYAKLRILSGFTLRQMPKSWHCSQTIHMEPNSHRQYTQVPLLLFELLIEPELEPTVELELDDFLSFSFSLSLSVWRVFWLIFDICFSIFKFNAIQKVSPLFCLSSVFLLFEIGQCVKLFSVCLSSGLVGVCAVTKLVHLICSFISCCLLFVSLSLKLFWKFSQLLLVELFFWLNSCIISFN